MKYQPWREKGCPKTINSKGGVVKISFLKGVLIVLVLVGLAVISESVAAKGVPQRFNRSSIISERIARADGRCSKVFASD